MYRLLVGEEFTARGGVQELGVGRWPKPRQRDGR